MPATQCALWTLIAGDDPGKVFEIAERLKRHLTPSARLARSTPLFSYRSGRDLSGFADGSANPQGERAVEAAFIDQGPLRGGSFALVQRFLHFRDRFATMSADERSAVVGRTEDNDEELPTAPRSAHIKRADQLGFDPPALMLRRSMPWGDARRHGLQFIAFMNRLDKAQRMLRRMVAIEDGLADALLGHTQAETGAFYFVPAVADGRLMLPESSPTESSMSQRDEASVNVATTPAVRLRVDIKRCIHSRNCVLSRPDVFVPNVVGTWLHPELATMEELVEIANQCPSGAIQYDRLDDGPGEAPKLRNVIRIRENGPYAFHGHWKLGDQTELRMTLCRCGHSSNKPFCDGSHATSGFAASGEPMTVSEDSSTTHGGCVAVQPIADGPLTIHGPVELVSGTGRPISRAYGPTLCRCGHSGNKPFCDGSHARVGFSAPE